jgi:hypothetical protein
MNMYFRLPNKFLLCLLTITGAALVGASAATINPLNDGFEEANLGGGFSAYQYSPPSTSWTYHSAAAVAGAGIAANGSVFGVTGATNGNYNGATSTVGQAAFLQMGDGTLGQNGAYISQMISLAAGSYDLNFSLEGRLNYGANGVNVFVNGVQIGGTLFPASLGSFNDVSLNLGNLAAGSYAIAFAGQGANGRDVTTFIDNIAIVSTVPDSGGTFMLMFCSGAALFVIGGFASRQSAK